MWLQALLGEFNGPDTNANVHPRCRLNKLRRSLHIGRGMHKFNEKIVAQAHVGRARGRHA